MINVEEIQAQSIKKIPTEKTIQKIRPMDTEIPLEPAEVVESCDAEGKPIPFRLLSIQDMAAIVNCSVASVYTMKAYGRIPPPLRVGRLVRWDPRVVQKWVDDGCPSFGKKVVVRTNKRKR